MILDGLNAKRFGDAFATATGCSPTASEGDRIKCLRGLDVKDVLLPYISWFCLLNKTSNPYCNHSTTHNNPDAWPNLLYTPAPLHNNFSTGRYWPTPLPPMAPIAAFTAVVDGSQSGLPEVPLRLIKAGKINTSPKGEKVTVIMGTNKDEFALFLIAIDLVIPG